MSYQALNVLEMNFLATRYKSSKDFGGFDLDLRLIVMPTRWNDVLT